MIFWLLLSGVFLAALAMILIPLLRHKADDAVALNRDGKNPKSKNIEVYKAQLQELEADLTNGLLSETEATSARLEIERRLLRVAEESVSTASPGPTGNSPALTVMATTLLLLVCVAFYLNIGMPGMPDFVLKDQPHSLARIADEIPAAEKIAEEVANLEALLAKDPTDVKAWRALGEIQSQLQNRVAAAQALQHWYQLEPDSIDAAVVYSESLIMLADGRVGPAALLALNKARAMQPRNPGVRHYLALAQYQAGNIEQALEGWESLKAESRPDVPWLGQLRRWIRRAQSDLGIETAEVGPGALSDQEREAIGQMSADEQMAMIKGMVGRLQDKMDQNPENIEGWFRLAKAYMVLGQKEDAVKSLEQAELHAPSDLKKQIKKQLAVMRQSE